MKRLRIYVDTSVFGGCMDEEFATESQALLDLARTGRVTILVSDLLVAELAEAPPDVQVKLSELRPEQVETLVSAEEARRLRDAYLAESVVGPASANDAHHVAIATVARADMLVSWNFKHLVHFEKMRGFNAVNLREGYSPIEIHSPLEVI